MKSKGKLQDVVWSNSSRHLDEEIRMVVLERYFILKYGFQPSELDKIPYRKLLLWKILDDKSGEKYTIEKQQRDMLRNG